MKGDLRAGWDPRSAKDNSGIVDHVAFLAVEPQAFAERLAAFDIVSRKRFFPQFKLFQMFIQDPTA